MRGLFGEEAMKKFINHVDHAVYLSKWENLDANIARLELLTDSKLERSVREEMGAAICVDWSTGLEMVSPTPDRIPANEALHARLESHGEGLLAVVYGVADLEAHKAKLEARGFQIGPLMETHPSEPWFDRIVLRERFAPPFLDSWMVFSEIDYASGLIRYVEVEQAAAAG
jgi:hypothetical protein